MPAFHDVGQFYWLNVKNFLDQKLPFGNLTLPVEVPESEVQDRQGRGLEEDKI